MACLSIQPVQNSNLTFLSWREEQKHGRMRISPRRKAEERIEPEHAPVGHAKEGMVNKTPQQLHKMLSTFQMTRGTRQTALHTRKSPRSPDGILT